MCVFWALEQEVFRCLLWVATRWTAVETLYSAFPMFIYVDPKLDGLLLEPLFRLDHLPNSQFRTLLLI